MPPRRSGHGPSDDGPGDGGPPRPPRGGGSGRRPRSVREAQDDVAGAAGAGRPTEHGGTGGRSGIDGPSAPRPRTDDLRTHRSGRPGSTPDGHRTTIERGEDAEVRRSLEMENSGAVVFAGQGYRIQQNPTKVEVA